MNWRDGHASNWGDAIRRSTADIDQAILAHEKNALHLIAMLENTRAEIERLQRVRWAAKIVNLDVAAIPTAAAAEN